ncbi:MAG: hypothetical protein MZU91_12300 [Desulfosudis oleivorans]|nr:hypothetical protein [Desulfosudis oleivorans]
MDKKKKWFPGETAAAAKVIIVDPRRSATVAICEQVAGKDNVLHLDIEPGTDTALFNALFTYVVEQGWHRQGLHRQAHHAASTRRSKTNRMTLEDGSQGHRRAGGQASSRRPSGPTSPRPAATAAHLPRLREGHHLGQRQLRHPERAGRAWCWPRTTSARRGTGVCRMGGHQEGYTRPPYPGDSKIYIDQEVINGKGLMYTLWGTNPFQTTLNAEQHRAGAAQARGNIVNEAIAKAAGRQHRAAGGRHLRRLQEQGRPVRRGDEPLPDGHRRGGAHDAAGRAPGRDEPDVDERRAAPAPVGEVHGPAGIGQARLPDRRRHRQHAEGDVPEGRQGRHGQALRGLRLEDRGGRLQRRLPPRRPAGRRPPIDSQGGDTGYLATYELLRKAGNNGVQLPIKERQGRQADRHRDGLRRQQVRHQGRPAPSSSPRRGTACRSRWPTRRPSTSSGSTAAAPTRSGRRRTTTSTTASCATATRWPIVEMNPEDARAAGRRCPATWSRSGTTTAAPTPWPTR